MTLRRPVVRLPLSRLSCVFVSAVCLLVSVAARAQGAAQAPGPSGALPAQGPVAAGPPGVIAMVPFDGKETPRPPKKALNPLQVAGSLQEVLTSRPQAQGYRVLSPDLWASIARLKKGGRSGDVRSIAKLLKASVVVGGFLESTPGPDAPKPFRLTLSLYDGDGLLLGQLGYDLDSPTLDAQRFVGQATAFFQMIDQALKLPTAAAPAVAQAPTKAATRPGGLDQAGLDRALGTNAQTTATPSDGRPVGQADDREEAPILGEGKTAKPLIPQSSEAHEAFDRRPPWQPALDLRIGYLFNMRSLSNDGSVLSFPRSGAHGMFIHGEVHPGAFFRSVKPALAGLGLRLSAMLPFWREVQQVNQAGGSSTGSYQVSERRVEIALRWHYNYWDAVFRPDFELEGLFGDHSFNFSDTRNIDYLRIPPSEYRYLGALFGARLHFPRNVQARLAVSVAKMLSLGLMTTPGQDAMGASLTTENGYQSYGPGSGWLWRTDLGLGWEFWRGLSAGFGFYYEQNKLSFEGKQSSIIGTDGMPVTRAQDEYLGVMLTLGYVFRPFVR